MTTNTDYNDELRTRLHDAAYAISDESIKTVWRAAMTGACNAVIHRQNRLNNDDGPDEVINEQGECIRALKELLEPDEVYMRELRAILAAPHDEQGSGCAECHGDGYISYSVGAISVSQQCPTCHQPTEKQA